MEIIKINKINNYSNMYSNKLNVAAYVRVSTSKEVQLNSLESQKLYFIEKINKYMNWNFLGIYEDEGISGRNTKSRKGFNKMIKDALNGNIDLILVKSFSRFSRNVSDAIEIIRKLREKNIGIFFEEENIYTLDMRGELLLTILFSIAEQETANVSLHVQLGKEMLATRGIISNGAKCYGYDYDKETKTFKINPKEANVVKTIFYMYGKKHKSVPKIKQYLKLNKIKTYCGNEIWNEANIMKLLKNERYIGNISLMKRRGINVAVNLNRKDYYHVTNFCDKIIDEKLFDLVQERIKERTKAPIGNNSDKPFLSMLRCPLCGYVYRYTGKNYYNIYRDYLVCNKCSKKGISSNLLINIFNECVLKIINEDLLSKIYKELKNFKTENIKLNKKKEILENQKLLLLNNYYKKKDLIEYNIKLNLINEQIKELMANQEMIKLKQEEYEKNNETIKRIYDSINKNYVFNEFNDNFFKQIVSFILIGGIEENVKYKFNYNIIRFIFRKNKELIPLKIIPEYTKGFKKLNNYNTYILVDYKSKYKRKSINPKEYKRSKNYYNIRVRFEIIDY